MSNVPSHTRAALCGSRISAAHLPQGLCRTPLYRRFRSPLWGSSLAEALVLVVVRCGWLDEVIVVVVLTMELDWERDCVCTGLGMCISSFTVDNR